MTKLNDWNFRGSRLQSDIGGKDFVTSESTLILISPKAKYEPGVLQAAEAVGLTQDLGFNQSRQVVQVHEVGSNQKYTLSSSRTNGNLNISRVLFDGKSLLRVMGPDFNSHEDYEERDKPGYGDFLMNLGSSLFSKPVGMLLVFRDLGNQNIGGVFFEEVFLVSHNMQVSSNSPFLGEGVQMLYNSVLPLQTVSQ